MSVLRPGPYCVCVCAQEERDRAEAANAAAEQALSLRRHAEEALESGRRELEHTQVGCRGMGGSGGRGSSSSLGGVGVVSGR